MQQTETPWSLPALGQAAGIEENGAIGFGMMGNVSMTEQSHVDLVFEILFHPGYRIRGAAPPVSKGYPEIRDLDNPFALELVFDNEWIAVAADRFQPRQFLKLFYDFRGNKIAEMNNNILPSHAPGEGVREDLT